jgi:hypothetical protein
MLAWAAQAAAREAGDPAAAAAARAALSAAGSAYLHPIVTPHQSKHILAAAVYAAVAKELEAGGDAAVGDAEIRWAIGSAPRQARDVLLRLPAREPGRSRLDALYFQLDAGLRDSARP